VGRASELAPSVASGLEEVALRWHPGVQAESYSKELKIIIMPRKSCSSIVYTVARRSRGCEFKSLILLIFLFLNFNLSIFPIHKMTDHPYFSILKFNLSIFPIHNMMDHPYFSIF
jgi:hypothetical protein